MSNTKRNYLCLHRSKPGGSDNEKPSPAKMQEMYASFQAWKSKFEDKIVDMGGKLDSAGQVVTRDGVTDGPFVEAKEVIGGYMIVAAESIEEAAEVARGIVGPGSSVEVRLINTP